MRWCPATPIGSSPSDQPFSCAVIELDHFLSDLSGRELDEIRIGAAV
jgi:hypothetical protein